MDMNAYTRNIKDILSLDRKYTIPRFQREYSWEKQELTTMFNDIVDQINKEKELAVSEYFIGSLVLVGDDTKNSEFFVVDGQQRLTTITIILSALGDKFLKLGENKLASSIHKYIVGTDDNGSEYYKLENENPRPFFQLRIQSLEKEVSREPHGEEEERLLKSYEYFSKQLEENNLRKNFQNVSDISYVELLKIFRDQVLAFKTIYITVSDIDTAYTIFETLNAKGKDLSSVDLIKNKVFQLITDDSPIDKTREKWKQIRNILYERNSKIQMTLFYRHFWISKYSKVTESKLYEEFGKRIDSTQQRYNEFLEELVTAAEWYVKIHAPQAEDWNRREETSIFHSLKALKLFDTKQVRSLLLALFEEKYERKNISEKYLKKALSGVENFQFLFSAIVSSRPSWLEGTYSKYARKLRASKNKNESHKIIDDLLEELDSKKPDFNVFSNEFEKLYWDADDMRDKELISYIFSKFESFRQSQNETYVQINSIEHISSQSKENFCYIGNLLPLEQELNSKAGDKEFPQKMEYYKESDYKVTKEFFEKYCNDKSWTKEIAIERSKQLAIEAYENVWRIK